MINTHTIKAQTKGAALLLFVLFFVFTSLMFVISISRGVYNDILTYRILETGKRGFYGAEAGIEDAIHRNRAGKRYSNTENFSFNGIDVTVNRTEFLDTFEFISEGSFGDSVRKSRMELVIGVGVSFNFGIQSGNGGIALFNSSSILGNVFSNGEVSGSGNYVYGDVISAGAGGEVDSIHATGSVWAHSIEDSIIDKDAYFFSSSTLTGTTVSGTRYANSPDLTPIDMPISDAQIEDWKLGIEMTGTLIASTSPQCAGGTYLIDTDTTLNNVKIECNVEMKKQGPITVITLAGPVWIEGNLDFTSGPSMVASSSIAARSILMIVDNESNRLTSSKVKVNNTTNFTSGNELSYVLLISMNNSAELGGIEKAIDLGQTTTGKLIAYASHGLVEIGQSTSLKEITAHKIRIINSAQVLYESGLINTNFSSGPGGGFSVLSWSEVQ